MCMLCGEEHICRGQRSKSGVTLQVCPICFLSQGPSLVLELTGEARLAGKSRGPLVFLFQGWPHMYFTMPGLYVTARIELRSSGLHSTPSATWTTSSATDPCPLTQKSHWITSTLWDSVEDRTWLQGLSNVKKVGRQPSKRMWSQTCLALVCSN